MRRRRASNNWQHGREPVEAFWKREVVARDGFVPAGFVACKVTADRFALCQTLGTPSVAAFLSAITRLKQSGQAYRMPPPSRVRDNGRMVEDSTRRRHSGHRLIFEGSLLICSPLVSRISFHVSLAIPVRARPITRDGGFWRHLRQLRRVPDPSASAP